MRFTMLLTSLGVLWSATATAVTYDVGPDRSYASILDVPLDSLGPGDVVEIHWRAEPYRERFGIDAAGTSSEPIVVRGIPSSSGELPVIDGEGSTGGYNSHVRGLIHVDGAAAWVIVENLELRNANAGSGLEDNSAGVFAPGGSNLTFRNLDIHHNGNGFFSWVYSSNVTVEGCSIHDNGNVGSIYEHNVYTESDGITFQYNVLAPLLAGAGGNNLKDRSHSATIRYNWIEGGNRCLDLVDAEDGDWVYSDATDYVYANVLIKHDDTSQSQVVHYGGDNASAPDRQELQFFHNTVYTDRPGNTTLFFVNAAASVGAYNNVFVTGGGDFELVDPDDSDAAVIELGSNWIADGWFVGSTSATVNGQGNLIVGTDPDLANVPIDFAPVPGSPVVDAGSALPGALAGHPVDREFAGLGQSVARNDGSAPDLGAFALDSGAGGATSTGGAAATGGAAGAPVNPGGSANPGGGTSSGGSTTGGGNTSGAPNGGSSTETGGANSGGGTAGTGGSASVGGATNTGGITNDGGVTEAGGTPERAGASSGGRSETGGDSPSGGHRSAGGGGVAGSARAQASSSDDDSGCGCEVPSPRRERSGVTGLLLLALALARRRR